MVLLLHHLRVDVLLLHGSMLVLLVHGVLLLLVCWVREVELLLVVGMLLLLLHACRIRSGRGSRSVSRAAVRRLADTRNRMVLRVHHTRTKDKKKDRTQTEVTARARREQTSAAEK